MLSKFIRVGVVAGCVFAASSVFALNNNTHPLPAPFGTGAAEPVLVQNAKVSFLSNDIWLMGMIVWQLITTDANPAGTSPAWLNNECSANAPHSNMVSFLVSATGNLSLNKLQKTLSLLQTSQLTGMQVTITGATATGVANQGSECVPANISHVYLRNTTF
jgi:hypothetical protein